MIVFILTLIAMVMAAVFCMYTNFRDGIKAVAIVYLIISTLFVVTITHNYKGQPIFYKQIPSELIVYGQEIDQEAGFIHILCREYEEGKLMFIRTPYDMDMHKAMDQGQKQSKGKAYMLKRGEDGEGGDGKGDGKGKGKGGKEGDGDGEGKGTQGSLSHESERYWSAPMPKPRLPRKDTKNEEQG